MRGLSTGLGKSRIETGVFRVSSKCPPGCDGFAVLCKRATARAHFCSQSAVRVLQLTLATGRNMKKLALAIIAVGLLTATGAWASMFVSNDVKSAQSARGSGSSFTRLLHRQYTALASEALKESDHLHARRYVTKALAASGGAEPAPENPAMLVSSSRSRKPCASEIKNRPTSIPANTRKTFRLIP